MPSFAAAAASGGGGGGGGRVMRLLGLDSLDGDENR